MKRPQLVSAGTLSRIVNTARLAWNNRDFQQSIELFERACKLNPADPALLLELGRAYGLRYDHASAERNFEKAVRVSSQKATTLTHAGIYCREFSTHAMAESYLQRAAEQKDATAETFVRLAELYERLHRSDEALKLIDRALSLDPSNSAAGLARAKLDRQAGHLEQAENSLRKLLPKVSGPNLALTWYELGTLLDKTKRYDEAMAAFTEAKSILRQSAGQQLSELKIMRTRLEELRRTLSSDIFQRWSDAAKDLLPTRQLALLGGHPRSGTTLLEQVLDSHPDIVSVEETNIFHDEAYVPLARNSQQPNMLAILESAKPDDLKKSRANYFHFAELSLEMPISNRLLIDKNPSLTFLIPALIRTFPEIKLLIALRDPRDVCLSCFMQSFVPIRQGNSAYLSLASTVDEYVALMEMWKTLASLIKNPLLEIRYEDMVEDLESVSHKVLSFLNIPWDARVLQFNEHAQKKMVRSPTYADVAKPVFKTAVGRWKNYQKYLEPYLTRLEPFVRMLGYE